MTSVVFANPGYEVYLWRDEKARARGWLTDEVVDRMNYPAGTTSLTRLFALKELGGVYVDCDVRAHKSFDSLLDNEAFAADQGDGRICDAVIGSEPNGRWVTHLIDTWRKWATKDPICAIYAATAAPRDGLTVVPTRYFYPYLYNDPPEKRTVHADTIVEHLWMGSWK